MLYGTFSTRAWQEASSNKRCQLAVFITRTEGTIRPTSELSMIDLPYSKLMT